MVKHGIAALLEAKAMTRVSSTGGRKGCTDRLIRPPSPANLAPFERRKPLVAATDSSTVAATVSPGEHLSEHRLTGEAGGNGHASTTRAALPRCRVARTRRGPGACGLERPR